MLCCGKLKLTMQAYCKMVLHGAKYPHCAVNGLLVAERPLGALHHDQARSPSLFINSILPFHSTLALAPIEVALTLVRRWALERWAGVQRRDCLQVLAELRVQLR